MEYINLMNENIFEIGSIKSFEGELLQVKVNKVDKYRLGDKLSCSYNKNFFKTTILKKINDSIYLYFPLTKKEVGQEKRRNPRINVDVDALLNSNMEENIYHVKPATKISIKDISINGIGFTCSKKLAVSLHPYYIYLEIASSTVKLEVILKYKEPVDQNTYKFGCEIKGVSKRDLDLWLKFILKSQILQSLGSEAV